MAVEITIPRLGWSMEEGVFVKWLKADGDWVRAGDQLFLLESDKATQEIESLDEGLLRIPPNAPQPGETVRVGQVIGHLVAKDEVATHTEPVRPASGPPPAAGPAARRLSRQMNVSLKALTGSGDGGRITSADVHAEADRSAPSARAAADLDRTPVRDRDPPQQIKDESARRSERKTTMTPRRGARHAREASTYRASPEAAAAVAFASGTYGQRPPRRLKRDNRAILWARKVHPMPRPVPPKRTRSVARSPDEWSPAISRRRQSR